MKFLIMGDKSKKGYRVRAEIQDLRRVLELDEHNSQSDADDDSDNEAFDSFSDSEEDDEPSQRGRMGAGRMQEWIENDDKPRRNYTSFSLKPNAMQVTPSKLVVDP